MTLEILSRTPKARSSHAPLMFVHGGYAGAWVWDEYFLPYFAQCGFEAHAVSLRGHGGSPAPGMLDLAGIDDYVVDLLLATAALDRPPVLVGHSMGAIVVQRAARRCAARGLVLMAPVPPHGLTGSILTLATRDPPLFLGLNTMQFSDDEGNASLRRVRDYLFSQSVSEADARRHLMRMHRESSRALADLAWPQHLWIRQSVGIPTMVIGAERDAFFPTSMTQEAAAFHGVTPVLFPDMAHAMMLEPGWQQVASTIADWLMSANL